MVSSEDEPFDITVVEMHPGNCTEIGRCQSNGQQCTRPWMGGGPRFLNLTSQVKTGMKGKGLGDSF